GQKRRATAFILLSHERRRFGGWYWTRTSDPCRVRGWVVQALFNKGAVLSRQDKPDAEIAVCEDIDRRFGKDNSPGARKGVAKARELKQLP
ncbi:MAG: hypothetical protein LBF93_07020, partial [Zoogloeaceae bacterium]|nr:hypothetical protein [Zoogloeaceae bacterium]